MAVSNFTHLLTTMTHIPAPPHNTPFPMVRISPWTVKAPLVRGHGERAQPSFRRPGVGAAQAADQNRKHLDGDLRTML
jgi:hypothetical protein